ncbi:hypothetical protein G6W51_28955 [Streptomyces coelicolor]|uniref:Uncharacterized protein n=3 Tax=Streptomyces TaxID=1883 RepID=A0ABT0W4A1_STRGI|nr:MULTISPECIES: hypothetical protein [Streptomyces]MBJ6615212.1 hypothetical protein [Streptomyces sp. I3(2020)]NUV56869.1 hypothetical protein [Streptomyces coelicolor]MBJ6625649.1 hypothetical protein [Streptomyces sp. I4(2020)]MCM2517436.1 hypothetical protein [Streptomyces griseoincarnatus]MDH3038153.1 hypothetical protein [Streptomyces sp. TRM75561]
MARYMEALTVERGGFRIKVPESWWEFDVRPESRDDSIHRMVTERLRAHPELTPHRDTYISFLRKAAADAWKSGALYCGCMAETFGGDTPITGSVTVSLVGGRTSKGDPLPTDPEAVIAQLAVKEARREGDSWRKVTTVDIPGVGPAARTYGIEDVPVPDDELGRTIRAVLMQTFIPVPGQEGKVALVAGSSQVLDLAESFFDIFDAITSTFRFAD